MTINLRPQVDLPIWEQLRFAPAVSSSSSSTCMSPYTNRADGGRF